MDKINVPESVTIREKRRELSGEVGEREEEKGRRFQGSEDVWKRRGLRFSNLRLTRLWFFHLSASLSLCLFQEAEKRWLEKEGKRKRRLFEWNEYSKKDGMWKRPKEWKMYVRIKVEREKLRKKKLLAFLSIASRRDFSIGSVAIHAMASSLFTALCSVSLPSLVFTILLPTRALYLIRFVHSTTVHPSKPNMVLLNLF